MGQPGHAVLNAIPAAFYPGPSNSVVATLLFKSTNGLVNLRIATIDESGMVLGSFAAPWLRSAPVVCVQPDQRILVAGSFSNWSGQPVTGLVRVNVDGSLDSSFDVRLGRSNAVPIVSCMALDDLGRLVIAGAFDSVNGVARPGLARVFAYEAPPKAPELTASVIGQPRIATNEVLNLTASVSGFPGPDLQWYRNGIPIPGATSRGLRIVVEKPEDVGTFYLVATNASGSTTLDFPTVDFAPRSPTPGASSQFEYWSISALPSKVNHLVPLADGRVLAGCGGFVLDPPQFTNTIPVVVCLLPGGLPDPAFGNGGSVSGNGFVNSLRVLPNGHIFVAGGFTEFAGAPASGLAELDASGTLVSRSFPILSPSQASRILPLPSGGYAVSGLFTNVAGVDAYRMVKLMDNLEVDPTFHSPLGPNMFVDAMELDPQGKVLIGGTWKYSVDSIQLGLKRLLPDGSLDPDFKVYNGAVREFFVEPEGTILIGRPFSRLSTDGEVLAVFDPLTSQENVYVPSGPEHTVVRLPDGGGIQVFNGSIGSAQGPGQAMARWLPSGQRDESFGAFFDRRNVEAATILHDGSILASTFNTYLLDPILIRQLVVVPADPDLRLSNPRRVEGQMVVDLATQPGRHYEIRRLTDLASGASTLVAEIEGDG
jgi:uncharacterized delta-60 repeat protein